MLNRETILVGDINVNYLDKPAFKKHCLIHAIFSMNFKQLVTQVTRAVSGTCLDHVFANCPERIHTITIRENGLADHLPVFGVRLYKLKGGSSHREKLSNIFYRNMKCFILLKIFKTRRTSHHKVVFRRVLDITINYL